MPLTAIESVSSYREIGAQAVVRRKNAIFRAIAIPVSTIFLVGAVVVRVANYRRLGDSHLINMTAYSVAASAYQGLIETLPQSWMETHNNFFNNWLLELGEAEGQIYKNVTPNYTLEQLRAFFICSMKVSSMTRVLIAPKRGGFLSMHPTIPDDFRAEPLSMLFEWPCNNWISTVGYKGAQALISSLLIGWGRYSGKIEYEMAGWIWAGYSGGIFHRPFRWLRDHLQNRAIAAAASERYLDETPQVGCSAGRLQQMMTIAWDLRDLALATLLAANTRPTFFAAGFALSCVHDTHLESFQKENIEQVILPELPKIGHLKEFARTAWKTHHKGLMVIEILSDITKFLLTLGMFGFIGAAAAFSPLPDIALLAGFTGGLLAGNILTLIVYYSFHSGGSNHSSLKNQLYFLLMVYTELFPFIYCWMRTVTPLDNKTEMAEDLSMQILGVLGFTLFGIGWGNSRASLGLLSKRDRGLIPPSLIGQFELSYVYSNYAIHRK